MTAQPIAAADAGLETRIADLSRRLDAARAAVRQSVYGQDGAIDLCLTAILSGGHFLLVGLPGLGKTRLVNTLGQALGLDTRRIQCTPDLMPADVIGAEVLDHGAFRFIKGPVFSQFLMADEINRASPRTQSALLQAMQEGQVSVGGVTHDLPRPFHVMATQNPLEHEGTYPLPEAQLDRFLLQIDMGYPAQNDERRMMIATTSGPESAIASVFDAALLLQAQDDVRRLPVGERVVDGILALVRAGRPDSSPLESVRAHASWGPGPRASQAFMLAARARALLDGRLSPSLDDVAALAPAVLHHRMALNFTARAAGVTLDEIIQEMCEVLS